MDLTSLAVDLLERLPANRTLGLTVVEAIDGIGRVEMPVSDRVRNVIGALHSSGVAALADAAALSVTPDETLARRLQPLGVEARLTFERPLRGTASAVCQLDARLYQLVRQLDAVRERTLEITFAERAKAYAFTFG